MTKLTKQQLAARALRDLYATRYPLTTWGFIWRIGLATMWLVTIVVRVLSGVQPTWLTPIFAVAFTALSREIWDGLRRRRHDRWESEQQFEEKE